MELDKNERSIFGFFPSSTKAQQAMEDLKRENLVPGEGYMQLDRISRHAVVNNREIDSPMSNAVTLSGLTHYSDGDNLNEGPKPLLAANDSESGRGVYDDNFAGRAFMVTLVTSKDNVDKAVQIIKNNDGRV